MCKVADGNTFCQMSYHTANSELTCRRLFTLMASFQFPHDSRQHGWLHWWGDQMIPLSHPSIQYHHFINLPSCALPGRRLVLFLVHSLYFLYILSQLCDGTWLIPASTDKTSSFAPSNGTVFNLHFILSFYIANFQKICFSLGGKPGYNQALRPHCATCTEPLCTQCYISPKINCLPSSWPERPAESLEPNANAAGKAGSRRWHEGTQGNNWQRQKGEKQIAKGWTG